MSAQLRRMTALTFTVAALFSTVSPIKASNIAWSNPAGGNWNVAANWGGTIPSASDNAFLNTLSGAYIVSETDSRTVGNLTINAANATLSQSGDLTVNGTFALNAGVYSLTGGTTTITSLMAVAPAATANWSGGTLAGTGTISGLVTASGGAKTLSGAGLQFSGTLRWISGSIFTPFGGVPVSVTNQPGGLFDLSNDGSPFAINTASPGTVIVQGTLRKSGGSSSSSDIGWSVNLSNGCTVDVQTGVLNFNNGGTLAQGVTTISGSGRANLNQGTFTIPTGDTFTASGIGGSNLRWTGGTLTAEPAGAGILAGLLVAAGGAKEISNTTLQIGGTLQWSSGSIFTPFGGIPVFVTNLSSGLIDITADGAPFAINTASPGTIVNQGTIRKSGGSALSTDIGWAVQFRSGSRVEVQTGALNFNNGGTLANGTTTIVGPGTANLNQGTFSVPSGDTFTPVGSGSANLRWTGGTLTADPAGTGIVAGTLVATGGAKTISNTTLQFGGLVLWNAGTINTPFGGIPVAVTINSSGVFDLQADGNAFIIDTASPGTIINQGVLKKTAGNFTSSVIAWNIANSGTITAQTGTLNLNGTNTNTGLVTMGPTALIGGNITSNVGGRVQGPNGSNAIYNGVLTFNAGSTLAPGTAVTGSETGGITLNNNLIMSPTSTMEVQLKGLMPLVEYDRVTVNGTITLNNATLVATFMGFTPLPSDTYFIVVNDGTDAVVGTFNGLPNGSVVNDNGYVGRISYVGDASSNSITGGNDVVLYNFVAIPEPAVWLVAMMGVLSGLRHRR